MQGKLKKQLRFSIWNWLWLLIIQLVYLKTYLPIVADHGYVDVIADQRHNGNYQSDAEKKCFGFGISIPDGEDKKCPLLLEYRWVLKHKSLYII